jgi:hypothetical protein
MSRGQSNSQIHYYPELAKKREQNKQHVKEASRVKGYVKLGSKEECMKHL